MSSAVEQSVEVVIAKFTKRGLLQLSKEERSLVVQLGHVCNEVAFLHKLLLVTSDTEGEGVERVTATAQALIVIRLLAGKVFEAWRMLGQQYWGSKLRTKFDPLLPASAIESFRSFSKHFGSDNLLSKLRNKFAFHYIDGHIEQVVAMLPDDYQLRLISGESFANTLYAFSEDIVTYGMLNEANETLPQAAMEKLVGNLIAVSGALLNYANHLIAVILESHLETAFEQASLEHHEVQVGADLETFKMPFFFTRSARD